MTRRFMGVRLSVGLGVAMFKALSLLRNCFSWIARQPQPTRLDGWLGVGPGWGLTFAIAFPCALLSLFLQFSLIVCTPCLRTIFALLHHIQRLL